MRTVVAVVVSLLVGCSGSKLAELQAQVAQRDKDVRENQAKAEKCAHELRRAPPKTPYDSYPVAVRDAVRYVEAKRFVAVIEDRNDVKGENLNEKLGCDALFCPMDSEILALAGRAKQIPYANAVKLVQDLVHTPAVEHGRVVFSEMFPQQAGPAVAMMGMALDGGGVYMVIGPWMADLKKGDAVDVVGVRGYLYKVDDKIQELPTIAPLSILKRGGLDKLRAAHSKSSHG